MIKKRKLYIFNNQEHQWKLQKTEKKIQKSSNKKCQVCANVLAFFIKKGNIFVVFYCVFNLVFKKVTGNWELLHTPNKIMTLT